MSESLSCNACGEQQSANGYCHNKQCSRHGRTNDYSPSNPALRASETTAPSIDTGDTVFHAPTGETWTVAYVRGDRLAWCGWPEGEAQLSDCTLVEKATAEDRLTLLRELAAIGPRESGAPDMRANYARSSRAVSAPRVPEETSPRGIYVASRSMHGRRWCALRDQGFPVSATWIDESEIGQTESYADLWMRCIDEARTSAALILFAPTEDGELKGALVEVGAALGADRPVYFVGDGFKRRYSWLAHPNVTECETIEDAMALALADYTREATHV